MTPALGGHISAGSGLRHVVLKARALGYGALQTMLGDPRGYEPYDISEESAEEFKRMTFGIQVYVHLPYILNPCEVRSRRSSFYRNIMRRYIKVSTALGSRGVVFHPGFRKELTIKEAYTQFLWFMEKVMEDEEPLEILIETDAGSKNGSAVGSAKFIGKAVDDLSHPRLGMCVDTTHLYARGVNLWDPETLDDFLGVYHRIVRLVHLNVPDDAVSLGSHLDRHNTPFEERGDLEHTPLIKRMLSLYPCILERRSLTVQAMDVNYIRSVMGGKDGGT